LVIWPCSQRHIPIIFAIQTHLSRNFDLTVDFFIAGDTSVLGRVSIGTRVGTALQSGGNSIRPFAKVNGIWDYEHNDDATLTSGTVLKTGETAINLGGGVDVTTANGIALRIAGDWFTYDTELQGWSLSGGIGGSFDTFGLGNIAPGFVSLDLSGSRAGASAMARIRIPLGGAQ
jgi:hypothetical protein